MLCALGSQSLTLTVTKWEALLRFGGGQVSEPFQLGCNVPVRNDRIHVSKTSMVGRNADDDVIMHDKDNHKSRRRYSLIRTLSLSSL